MSVLQISLPPEVTRLLDSKMASGLYHSPSEVISDALRQMDSAAMLVAELTRERLQQALQAGLEQAATGGVADYDLQSLLAELDHATDADV